MYSLKSGSSTQLPKGFKDMMDTLGKRDDIKRNRDTLRRTLIKEEERRKTSEVNEDILKEIRQKSKEDALTRALPPHYQDVLDATLEPEELEIGDWTLTGAYRLQNEMHAVRYLYRKKVRRGEEQVEAAPEDSASVATLNAYIARQKQRQIEIDLDNQVKV